LIVYLSVGLASAQLPIHLYVFTPTDPSGLTDEATRERLAAVADMKKRLTQMKDVTITESADDATIRLEVISVGGEPTGQTFATAVPIGGAVVISRSPPMAIFTGRVKLTSGTFTTEFDAGLGPFGRSIGENLARKVEGWLNKNRKALAK
jgi:hypothetical protein